MDGIKDFLYDILILAIPVVFTMIASVRKKKKRGERRYAGEKDTDGSALLNGQTGETGASDVPAGNIFDIIFGSSADTGAAFMSIDEDSDAHEKIAENETAVEAAVSVSTGNSVSDNVQSCVTSPAVMEVVPDTSPDTCDKDENFVKKVGIRNMVISYELMNPKYKEI